MNKIVSKNQIVVMYIFAMTVYFVSYITRINYNTVLVEISTAENLSRSSLSLPLTASFITYGLGQIISGWMGDRFDAFRLISAGLTLSAIMNFLMPVFPKPYVMVILWATNGFAQALIYPPLMKIVGRYLAEESYAKACLLITVGSHAATLLMYLIAPVIILLLGWKFVFIFSVLCAAVFVAVWQLYAKHIRKNYGGLSDRIIHTREQAEQTEISFATLVISTGLILIMLAVVMIGFLRDGISTWMPMYLSDIFSLSNEISILTTVILPIFNIFSSYVILTIRTRWCRNELKLAGITFFAAAVAIVLLLVCRTNVFMSVLLLAFASACANSVNFLTYFMLPKFEKYGRLSLVTGLLNSCAYIGAAGSTYGFAAVSENYGWNVTLVLWTAIASVGMLCCFRALKKWKSV